MRLLFSEEEVPVLAFPVKLEGMTGTPRTHRLSQAQRGSRDPTLSYHYHPVAGCSLFCQAQLSFSREVSLFTWNWPCFFFRCCQSLLSSSLSSVPSPSLNKRSPRRACAPHFSTIASSVSCRNTLDSCLANDQSLSRDNASDGQEQNF